MVVSKAVLRFLMPSSEAQRPGKPRFTIWAKGASFTNSRLLRYL